MSVLLWSASLVVGNLLIWGMALFFGEQLAPVTLSALYIHTNIYGRALICSCVYFPVIFLVALPFRHQPEVSSFLQSVLNAGYVVVLAVLLGQRAFTTQVAVGGILMAATSLYLSYALLHAPPALR